ncbi:hypothetical protein C8K38_111211 [Rhodococcus sp. OK611]|nr:hypothetical protein C8K38_111211 [Rhodococcus sp. OK611]SNX91511.1 hypothetical protein SAMN05447004_11046 [Rhodococcus sp. OK270]
MSHEDQLYDLRVQIGRARAAGDDRKVRELQAMQDGIELRMAWSCSK